MSRRLWRKREQWDSIEIPKRKTFPLDGLKPSQFVIARRVLLDWDIKFDVEDGILVFSKERDRDKAKQQLEMLYPQFFTRTEGSDVPHS